MKYSKRCSLGNCQRKHYARGWCKVHYRRWSENGDTGPVEVWSQLRGNCSLDGCDEPHRQHGYCAMHFERWRKHNDPYYVAGVFGQAGSKHYKWLGDAAGYDAVHRRMRRLLGSARVLDCANSCGRKALHWAYDHKDADERIDIVRRFVFSTDKQHYHALCASCHKLLDLAWKK